MESQTRSTGPELRGSNLKLSKIISQIDEKCRRTKIVCTLGPACWEVSQLEDLIEAGMSIARFNFSHGDHEGHLSCLKRLREAAKNKNKHVAVMLDTKGPEIRSGFFAGGAKKITLTKGELITLTSDYNFKGDEKKLACSYASLATSVKSQQRILVADGSLVLTVLATDRAAGEVTCRIENTVTIGERKNMNLPGVVVDLPTFTEKDVNDIQNWGIKHEVDFIAVSFVRKASDIHKLHELLGDSSDKIKVISKIENLEGLQNYPEILAATDAIMVARGDLGMEIPPEKVFLAQKMMIREANIAGKPVVTATQMLESMITNPRPTRAECSDVANAVLDGTDCVMLSGETANGDYPVDAVTIMSKTCCEAESVLNYDGLYQAVRNSTLSKYGRLSTSESIASSSVKTAIDVKAKAIIVCSETGNTTRQISKFRPGMPVIVLTKEARVARQCYGYLKGVTSKVLPNIDDAEIYLPHAMKMLIDDNIVVKNDPVVVVHGSMAKAGATNIMKILYA